MTTPNPTPPLGLVEAARALKEAADIHPLPWTHELDATKNPPTSQLRVLDDDGRPVAVGESFAACEFIAQAANALSAAESPPARAEDVEWTATPPSEPGWRWTLNQSRGIDATNFLRAPNGTIRTALGNGLAGVSAQGLADRGYLFAPMERQPAPPRSRAESEEET